MWILPLLFTNEVFRDRSSSRNSHIELHELQLSTKTATHMTIAKSRSLILIERRININHPMSAPSEIIAARDSVISRVIKLKADNIANTRPLILHLS